VTVLDVSSVALAGARSRLGARAGYVTWIEADVTADWTACPVDIWHDRAVFHFLSTPDQREAYVAQLQRTLKKGGTAIIATFGLDGPTTCSGLPVQRYDPQAIAAMLGPEFSLVESVNDAHQTPTGAIQAFAFGWFTRR
jgi:ubiquinone/menaquinone biosynthesis C-methylase UbiE